MGLGVLEVDAEGGVGVGTGVAVAGGMVGVTLADPVTVICGLGANESEKPMFL